MDTKPGRGYALLIGIDDYSIYDATRAHNLPGGLNDVRAWWATCRRRGFLPEDIHVLTTPALDPADLPGVPRANVGTATRANILAARKVLHDTLSRPGAIGLITYSGHGDISGVEPVICPSDTDQSLAQTIQVRELIKGFGQNLTLVLDTCHAGPGPARAPQAPHAAHADKKPQPAEPASTGARIPLSLTGRALPASDVSPFRTALRDTHVRYFCAAELTKTAYQAEFEGRYQGAFTWALTSVLGQWKTVQPEGRAPSVTIPCHTARDYAATLLRALELDEVPGLHGVGVNELPFFGPAIPTSHHPDGSPFQVQFPPDLKLKVETSSVITGLSAVILVVSDPIGASFPLPNSESWSMPQEMLDLLRNAATGQQLICTATSFKPGDTSIPKVSPAIPVAGGLTPMLQMKTETVWTPWQASMAKPRGFYTFITSETGTTTGTAKVDPNAIRIVGAAFDKLVFANGQWSGYITWLQGTNTALRTTRRDRILGEGITEFGTYDAAGLPTAGFEWWCARVPVGA